jgi:hypothetical protein
LPRAGWDHATTRLSPPISLPFDDSDEIFALFWQSMLVPDVSNEHSIFHYECQKLLISYSKISTDRINTSRSNDCRAQSLRYCLQMKKANLTQLTVQRETLRALTSIELTRAAGGNDPFSAPIVCGGPAINNTNAVACPAPAAIATPPRS